MNNEILDAVRNEQQSLEAQLSSIEAEYTRKKKPLISRLEAIKALRIAYGDVADSATVIGHDAPAKAQVSRESSFKARIVAASTEILGGSIPMPTSFLLDRLEAQGLQFNAANKTGYLSVILSKDDRFVSDRRNGWSLRDKSPQDVAASAGLSQAEAVSQSIAPNRV
jgi:hypothetical protein